MVEHPSSAAVSYASGPAFFDAVLFQAGLQTQHVFVCFIFCWNEAYWTVRLTTNEAATLSKLIEGNRAPEGLFFGRLSAVSTAAVGPIVVLGWFCQKQLVKGLTFGAVK